MSGVTVEIRLDDKAAQAYLAALAKGDIDKAALMDDIAGVIEESTLERFETNIGPDGEPWTPSERVKQSQGKAKTLWDTGVYLLDTITSEADRDSAQVGTNSPIAAIHQWGGETGRNHATEMPERPFIGLSGNDNISVEETVLNHLEAL